VFDTTYNKPSKKLLITYLNTAYVTDNQDSLRLLSVSGKQCTLNYNVTGLCIISGFHREVDEICALVIM